MAAPVHRFAAVDWPPRRSHRPPSVPTVHTRGRHSNAVLVNIALERRPPLVTNLITTRTVTRDAVPRSNALEHHRSLTMKRHLKLAALVFTAMAMLLLLTIKLGLDKEMERESQNKSLRPLGSRQTAVNGAVMWALMACACAVFLWCSLSLCRVAPRPTTPAPPPVRAPAPPEQTARVSSTAEHLQQQQLSETSLDIVTPSNPPTETPEAPPPYKIAVLMPGRESPPPPAYSELS